jgi:hypothetical protein
MSQKNPPIDPSINDGNDDLTAETDFSPPRKQEQLRTTIGRVVQNDPLAAKRFQDLVGRALSKRQGEDELI